VNRKLQILIGGTAVLVIGAAIAFQTTLRVRRGHAFGQPHQVRNHDGTNYVVRLSETILGRVGTGYVVIVFLELQNPNPFELTLDRNDFILVDEDKDYYLPATNGTQTATIKVPARGVRDNAMLSFTVAADAFRGTIGLQVGHYYWVALKSEQPYAPQLPPDEFRSFKQLDWHD